MVSYRSTTRRLFEELAAPWGGITARGGADGIEPYGLIDCHRLQLAGFGCGCWHVPCTTGSVYRSTAEQPCHGLDKT